MRAVPFGWCLPDVGDHENCRVEFVDSSGSRHECICSCHKQKGDQ